MQYIYNKMYIPLNTTTIPVSALFAASHKWRTVAWPARHQRAALDGLHIYLFSADSLVLLFLISRRLDLPCSFFKCGQKELHKVLNYAVSLKRPLYVNYLNEYQLYLHYSVTDIITGSQPP